MKKIIALIFMISSFVSYSAEFWAKVGRNTDGDFTLTSTNYTSNAASVGSIEYVFNLNDTFKVGLEGGFEFLLINSNEYVNYMPIGFNLKHVQDFNDMKINIFASGGYNAPFITTTYSTQTIKEVTLGPYLGFGSSVEWDLFLFEVRYTSSFADIRADILQNDGLTTLEAVESTMISYLTFKFGYKFY